MGETINHMQYVEMVFQRARVIIPGHAESLVYIDKPDSQAKPPKTSGNFIPDLFYCQKGLMIIGEAKTLEDVERKHSQEQYRDYLKDASNFDGEAYVIFGVPWNVKNTLKNIIRHLLTEMNLPKEVHVEVVYENGGLDLI